MPKKIAKRMTTNAPASSILVFIRTRATIIKYFNFHVKNIYYIYTKNTYRSHNHCNSRGSPCRDDLHVDHQALCRPNHSTTQETCDCSNKIDEAYDLGYSDGSNLTTIADEDDNAVETFYDYETSKKKSKKDENTAGKGKKYQKSTGSPIVKQVGGLCPKDTQEITSGKNKGKCQRTGDWYKTYRGVDEKGRAFTCTGGRVSNGKQCVCDTNAGYQWNGSKCVKKDGTKCPSGQYFDNYTAKCKKP
ncbi:hypothetical protein ATCVBr0604L_473L [Acanthocystis turfacea Chlorella virus Br0604L]|nr:hypothetical protein ATCVBr0604L_473L [Acanthocystis turfacea Chlorella virus Br0604L]